MLLLKEVMALVTMTLDTLVTIVFYTLKGAAHIDAGKL